MDFRHFIKAAILVSTDTLRIIGTCGLQQNQTKHLYTSKWGQAA